MHKNTYPGTYNIQTIYVHKFRSLYTKDKCINEKKYN